MINNRDVNEKVFDLVLTQALKDDCEREIALYENAQSEHTFSEKFEKGIESIKKQLKKNQRAVKFKKFKQSIPKIAAAAIIVIMCATVVTNPTVNAFFRNIITSVKENFNHHQFIADTEITEDNFDYEIRPSYMTENFRLTNVFYGQSFIELEYLDDNDERITITYSTADDTEVSVNNEHSDSYTVIINKTNRIEAIFYESYDEDWPSSLVWTIGGYAFVITAQMELGEFVQIAENIYFH